MKLIQLNIWGGRLGPKLSDFIEAQDPDIVCLQEAIDLPGGRGALFVAVEELQAAMQAKYRYMSPVFTFNYMHRKADFGNCIISKFPIAVKKTIPTGREYVADFDWTEHTQNIRNLQHVRVELPGGSKLELLNHHGHHSHEHKHGDQETLRQCQIIADEIAACDGKIILTGDFNLLPDSLSLAQINSLLDNLTIQAKLPTTRTALTSKTEVCDYIFASDSVKVISFEASDELVSDHKALILNFE